MPTDSQSYHEGLDALAFPGQDKTAAAAAHRRISNPEPPSYSSLKSPERENLPSVSEDGEEVEELPTTHLVSHTQSLEDLRPRPLSHVFSVPADQLEDHLSPSGVPRVR